MQTLSVTIFGNLFIAGCGQSLSSKGFTQGVLAQGIAKGPPHGACHAPAKIIAFPRRCCAEQLGGKDLLHVLVACPECF